MPVPQVERKLAAIFAADIAGYSRLMARDEVGTLARLKACRAVVDELIASHRGRIFNTAGDSVVADFASAVDAVQCAVAVQEAIVSENAGRVPDEAMHFRIGVHVGEVMVDGNNLLGDAVNIAARLESLAEPDAIYVSAVVHDQVLNKLPLVFDDLGDQPLKNIARALRVYRVQTGTPTARSVAALPLPDKPSIAVLPFENMSGDPEQEYFADGMVEEITTAIARLPWLFVIARNSAFTYKGKAVDVKQVARELGVRYVLEGSVRKAANRVRITGQLIDTATGAHIWADRFDGALDDVFELQDQVASSVAGAIEPKLRQSEIERASRKPTESLDAYDLYLRALAESKLTTEGTGEAIRLLHRAIAIDPSYAPAIAALAWCRARQKALGYIDLADPEASEGVDLARRAIELGQDDPDTLWMAGLAIWSLAGETGIAEAAVDRAIVLNPNSANAWNARGLVKAANDQLDPAVDAVARAMRLSPLDPNGYYFKWSLTNAYFGAGRFDMSMELADQLLRDRPNLTNIVRLKVAMCGHLGLVDEARPWVERLRELHPAAAVAAPWGLPSGAVSVAYQRKIIEGLRKVGLPER